MAMKYPNSQLNKICRTEMRAVTKLKIGQTGNK